MSKTVLCFLLCLLSAAAQENTSRWEINTSAYFYFIPDDFFVLPGIKADKDIIHLEARYNYEDRKTVSGWIGYNFESGEELQLKFTPMAGLVLGQTDAVAPGLEIDLSYKNLEFYSEAEYLLDFEGSEGNFFYAWSELTYSPTEWLWFGLAGQRTRVYQTDLDIQAGPVIGIAYENLELSGYLMNPFNDDLFAIFSLSYDF